MLDGWYCRSIANMQASEEAGASNNVSAEAPLSHESRKDYSSDSSSDPEPEPNYKAQYLTLKKKLKYLIYENECFQDALRCSQKRLLKVSRDRSFLLDRLLQYEKHESSTSDSEDTESSDDTIYNHADTMKRKKMDTRAGPQVLSTPSALNKGLNNTMKRKRAVVPKKTPNTNNPHQASGTMMAKASPALGFGLSASDGHMTPEEVERHLQSRQSYLELLPERAPPTVPTEMFSNDPSLDRLILGLPRHRSASAMFAYAHTDDFYAVVRKRVASLMRRVRGSGNVILRVLSDKPDCPMPRHWIHMHVYVPSAPACTHSESNDVLENSPNVDEWFD